MKGWIVALAIALVAAGMWYAHHAGYRDGYAAGSNAIKADDADSVAAAQAQAETRQSAAANAGRTLQVDLAATIPAIEVHTHDTAQAIHAVYLGLSPASAGSCRRPDRVQDALGAAIDRANAAARGDLRPGASAGAASAVAHPP
jgi:hypothetical protein